MTTADRAPRVGDLLSLADHRAPVVVTATDDAGATLRYTDGGREFRIPARQFRSDAYEYVAGTVL
ncbi:MAG: hypothetical protein IPK85_03935 [Gemmatimonadetes bacterium]|nr:hypothetical protein [Gemmatimonadota bacterium]